LRVLPVEEIQPFGLEVEELVELVETALVEREIALENVELLRDVPDLPLERADLGRDPGNLGREPRFLRAGRCEPCLDVAELAAVVAGGWSDEDQPGEENDGESAAHGRKVRQGSGRPCRRLGRSGPETAFLRPFVRRQRPRLGDDRRLRWSSLVRGRIGLRDDRWTARIALSGLVRQLDHLGRLDLQPVPPEPALGLSKRSLHLGLLLRRELVELSYLPARSFRRYVVATVHGVSELDQEAGPETAHSL